MAEILSPAGGPEQAKAAVLCGADAVYLGLKQFSARNSAVNFDARQLKEIVSFCHRRAVKVYAAVNTMMFDSELEQCRDVLRLLCEVGVDGVISQDLCVVSIAEKCCPQLELHASTQMTLHTKKGCEFAASLGFTRTVLSRELPFEIISSLSGGKMETEVFVHGALCMSVSGQCLFSSAVGGRSANRGMCAQPCRLPCSVKKGREEYALSLKDMSLLDDLQRLEACGVDSMKIEGRMKRPEYAALSAYCAEKALNGEPYDKVLLKDVFSRGGFTDGYLKGRLGAQMFGRRTGEDAKNAGEAYPKIHELYRREKKRSQLSFFVTVKEGEPIKISAVDENGLYAEYVGGVPDTAKNRPCDSEFAKKQLSKLGETFYEADSVTCDIGGGLSVAASEFNSARRIICESISQQREEYFSRKVPFDSGAFQTDIERRKLRYNYSIRINAVRAKQLERLSPDSFDIAFLPLEIKELRQAVGMFGAQKIGVAMPRFTFNESSDTALLKEAASLGIKHILCTNFAHIQTAKELSLVIHAGMGLNTANTLAVKKLEQLGAVDFVASPEMKASQINSLGGGIPMGVFAYGRLPLMLTANCPIFASVGCKNCTGRVFDRTGRAFPIKCSKRFGYTELLNADITCISDKTDDFGAVDFMQIELFDESPERTAEVVKLFEDKAAYAFGGNVTRGLYYRGCVKN